MTAAARADKYRQPRLVGLTALNERTSARYDSCAGKHTPSGSYVERQFPQGPVALSVCGRCEVPVGGPRMTWTRGTMTR